MSGTGWPYPIPGDDDPEKALRLHYEHLRAVCVEMERILGADHDLPPKMVKRLDKAVTVMKVGFKIAKKAMKARKATGAVVRFPAKVA